MELDIIKKDKETIVVINGRVDTSAAPELEKVAEQLIADDVTTLVFDCSEMEYISSSGLRIFLGTHKKLAPKGGQFILEHLNKNVESVLQLTGFSNILNIR